MNELSDKIVNLLVEINPIVIHIFLMTSSFIETIFPPWPGDVFIVFAGVMMYYHIISPPITYISTLIGNILGTWIMYFVGNQILNFAHTLHTKIKIKFLRQLLESIINEKQREKTEIWIEKWGFIFVLFSRFFAGVRYFVSIIAGITKMNFFIFTLAFSSGVIIWNSILFLGGYLLSENWKNVLEWLNVYNSIMGIFIFIVIIFFILYIRKKPKKEL